MNQILLQLFRGQHIHIPFLLVPLTGRKSQQLRNVEESHQYFFVTTEYLRVYNIRVGKELQNSEKLETSELCFFNFVKHSLCILSENKLLLLQPCKKIVTMGTNKH